ncbi:MFS transporter [Streptomyces sp. NBC_00316]|uniref:MFS transporter n=1 Tax=Streptomyces sp. NBC_00316 TaxID=2975710 RepID=UPI002E2D4967|nr:MFS transporter [Streptomyces sp. NBC_00316]
MDDRVIDVRTELDEAPLRPFHWMLVGLVLLAILFDGYDVLAPSYVIHYVAGAWHLDSAQSGLLVSAGLVGVMLGALVQGVIADRFGRRPTMIGGLLVSGVFSLLTAVFVDSYSGFLAIRVVTGLGLGVVMPLGTAYINEYLPSQSRFRLASLAAAGFSLGAVGAAVIGVLYTVHHGWQVLFYVGSGAGVVGLAFLAVFPESAEYLAARGRTAEAARLLSRVRPERASAYREGVFAAVRPDAGRSTRSREDWLLPLRPPYLRTTVGLWLSAFLLLFVNYGLSTWTPNLLVERGDSFSLGFGTGAALHSLPFLGGILCGYVADRRLGRRGSLAVWCTVGALATVSVILTHNPFVIVAVTTASGFFLIGSQFMLNNTCAMAYPVQARGTGTGFMLGFGRLGGILGPWIGGAVHGAWGTDATFIVIAVAGALTVATSSVIAPTKEAAASSRAAQAVPA